MPEYELEVNLKPQDPHVHKWNRVVVSRGNEPWFCGTPLQKGHIILRSQLNVTTQNEYESEATLKTSRFSHPQVVSCGRLSEVQCLL